jgi:cell division transport system permease protein
MAVVLYYLNQTFVELQLIESKSMLGLLFGFIFFMGIFISWISTYFATQRFLNLRTDELYY